MIRLWLSSALERLDIGVPAPSDAPVPIKLAVMPRAANDAPCPASMPLPVGHDADR
jgi:hypothetical protein